MLTPRVSVWVSMWVLALPVAVFGCGRQHGGAPAQKADRSGTSGTLDAGPAPEPKLRGFRCTRHLTAGKGPLGALTLHFDPKSSTDFRIHLEFHCVGNCQRDWGTCDYSAELRAERGVLRDGFPGMAVRCTQSPEEPLAVGCGSYLGSDVQTVVTARSTSRLVRFTLPPTFDQGIPDQPPGYATYGCLPFVNYERTDSSTTRKSINLGYLQFPPEACEFDP